MQAKVIKTDAEHRAVLARLSELVGAKRGTPEGDEFELLATLAEAYERTRFAIPLPDPIEAIRFRMEQAGLTRKDLRPCLGSDSRVSEVLNGKRRLSLNMIRSLHANFGIPLESLMGDPDAVLPDNPQGWEWKKFPVWEMVKRNWICGFQGTAAEARERAEELVRGFLQPLAPLSQTTAALLRHKIRSGSEMDEYALLAWRARILILAKEQSVADYQDNLRTPDFLKRLTSLSVLGDGPRLAAELLQKNGVRLVVEKHLPKTYLDGAATMLGPAQPVVALTLRYDRLDNFWFTLCHELGHIALHLAGHAHDWFLDDMSANARGLEAEADRFAENALIPPSAWKHFQSRPELSTRNVCEFASGLGVHPAVVAGRIRRESHSYRRFSKIVGCGQVRKHFRLQTQDCTMPNFPREVSR